MDYSSIFKQVLINNRHIEKDLYYREDRDLNNEIFAFFELDSNNEKMFYEADFSHDLIYDMDSVAKTVLKTHYEKCFYMAWGHNKGCLYGYLNQFARYFDDLFFPGGDNMYFMSEDRCIYIYVDHEEFIQFYTK